MTASARSQETIDPFHSHATNPHPEQCRRLLEQGAQWLQRGDLAAARNAFEQALAADSREAIAHNCLGIIARLERRLHDAVRLFRQAIMLRPAFAEAHNNLGNTHRDRDMLEEAADCYRHAISLKPNFAEAHNNLGVICLARKDSDQAVRCFETAIALRPTYADAYNNLASAFRERGDWMDAIANLRTALQLCPNSPAIHTHLGNVFAESDQAAEALRFYKRALELDGTYVDAHLGLGNLEVDADRIDAAIEHYRAACARKQSTPTGWTNLGNALRLAGHDVKSRDAYIRAMTIQPREQAPGLRVSALCPSVFGSRDEMIHAKSAAMEQWRRFREMGGFAVLDDLPEPSFNWQFLDGNLRELKEAYAGMFTCERGAARLRGRGTIGIVVTGGHERLFLRSMANVLNRLNARQFQPVVVGLGASERMLRESLDDSIPIVMVPRNISRAASAIRESGFDVLYYWEIGTDATNYFLPFFRLAPIQCTSWGIQVTSGIPNVDYYLSSQLVEPMDAQSHYTERLLLASTLLTSQSRPLKTAPPRDRGFFGLHDQDHLYVCAQQPGKFHPDFDPLLADILRTDPHGIVVAAGDRYGHASTRLSERFSRTIPDVASRIRFLPRIEYQDYLSLLSCADVLLDPPHFGGVNSTYDGLAMAQPIVTLPSGFHRGEYTAGCYRKMDFGELVATSTDQFVRLAIRLGTDADYRRHVREELEQQAPILFEDDEAVREHERLFGALIEKARHPDS